MPNPDPYNRTFSFNDFQASNPSSPLPGTSLDNELENVELAINGTQMALEDIRRSDGALKNGIVTVDSLDATVAAGVGTGALASAAAAAASAGAAADSAEAAASSAGAASGYAGTAATSAGQAMTFRNEAETEKTLAQTARTGAQTARDFAAAWATAAEGVDVDDGVNPVGKSSYHWAQVALGAASGALPDGSVTETKIEDGAVTRAKLATAVTDELDGFSTGIAANAASTDIHELVSKSTPVDADEIRLADSAASFGFKKLSFVNLKAWVLSLIGAQVVTPWVAYTPTFTGFGAVSSVSFYSRRVGDSLEVRGTFVSGTSTATEARITLGYNGTNANVTAASTSKLPARSTCGTVVFNINSAATPSALVEQSTGYLLIGLQSASTNGYQPANGSSVASSGVALSINASVPISGW